jgi:hypothetical protein
MEMEAIRFSKNFGTDLHDYTVSQSRRPPFKILDRFTVHCCQRYSFPVSKQQLIFSLKKSVFKLVFVVLLPQENLSRCPRVTPKVREIISLSEVPKNTNDFNLYRVSQKDVYTRFIFRIIMCIHLFWDTQYISCRYYHIPYLIWVLKFS